MSSSHEPLRKRVEAVLDIALSTVSSLAESFASSMPLAVFDDDTVKKAVSMNGDGPSTEAMSVIPEESKEEEEQGEENEEMLEVHD